MIKCKIKIKPFNIIILFSFTFFFSLSFSSNLMKNRQDKSLLLLNFLNHSENATDKTSETFLLYKLKLNFLSKSKIGLSS
jgi:hypothetical protein